MLRRSACALATAVALPVALTLAIPMPAGAQPATNPGAGPTTGSLPPARPEPVTSTAPGSPAPAASTVPPSAPASTPAGEPATTPIQPAAAEPVPAIPAASEQPPAAPVDPVLAEVRRQLAEPARGNVDRSDRSALAAFYAERNEPLLWVAAGGFTPRARHAMAEIRKAEDWGLTAAAFELPASPQAEPAAAALAEAEIGVGLAALKYARHARGGRLDPAQISKHLDQKPPLRDPKVVLAALAATETPGDYLRDLHPKHEQFQRLREALLKVRGGQSKPEDDEDEAKVRLPLDGPLLKPGMEHPDVALLRRRLKVTAEAGRENLFDPPLQAALVAFQRERRMAADGLVGRGTRTALNGDVRQPVPAGSEAQRLIVNMERWRWMPERLGDLHVWDNVPEFTTRVFKAGQLIHSAKIIVGKVETPTAVFSANMRTIVFHPEWGVPDSIKVKELAPYLSGGGGFFFFGSDTSILDRQRMRVVYNGRPVSASSINWGSVDIRRFSFIQSAGPHNVLGVVKFLFPNRHDIYMHDTPQRELFEQSRRMFSHGCIRVHNPGRLAELLLAEDKGWPAEQVRGMLAQGYNNEVQLSREIPVHVTYFTTVAEDGKVSHHSDIYGHDARMVAALGGKAMPPELMAGDEPVREVRRAPRRQNDFFSGIFGN
jgi:L,D-transpeptidase YcbB